MSPTLKRTIPALLLFDDSDDLSCKGDIRRSRGSLTRVMDLRAVDLWGLVARAFENTARRTRKGPRCTHLRRVAGRRMMDKSDTFVRRAVLPAPLETLRDHRSCGVRRRCGAALTCAEEDSERGFFFVSSRKSGIGRGGFKAQE